MKLIHVFRSLLADIKAYFCHSLHSKRVEVCWQITCAERLDPSTTQVTQNAYRNLRTYAMIGTEELYKDNSYLEGARLPSLSVECDMAYAGMLDCWFATERS